MTNPTKKAKEKALLVRRIRELIELVIFPTRKCPYCGYVGQYSRNSIHVHVKAAHPKEYNRKYNRAVMIARLFPRFSATHRRQVKKEAAAAGLTPISILKI